MQAGAKTFVASDGIEGLRQLFHLQPVILDIMMPHKSGWETCRQIRELSNVPIIMLTSLNAEEDMVRGLDCGAVDYVTKPFSTQVLLARSRAALRQSESLPTQRPFSESELYEDGYLKIDLKARRVFVADKAVDLTKTEFSLLAYLFHNQGIVLTFEQILQAVWGLGYEDSIQYVHVYVSRLRQKLEQDPKNPQYLLTEYGVGYRLVML